MEECINLLEELVPTLRKGQEEEKGRRGERRKKEEGEKKRNEKGAKGRAVRRGSCSLRRRY